MMSTTKFSREEHKLNDGVDGLMTRYESNDEYILGIPDAKATARLGNGPHAGRAEGTLANIRGATTAVIEVHQMKTVTGAATSPSCHYPRASGVSARHCAVLSIAIWFQPSQA